MTAHSDYRYRTLTYSTVCGYERELSKKGYPEKPMHRPDAIESHVLKKLVPTRELLQI